MLTYGEIVKAVAAALKTANGVKRVQAYDEITESIPDWPLLQVYAESGEVDVSSGDMKQSAFGGGVQQTSLVINIDGYARRRSHLGADLKAQMELIDAVDAKLCAQEKPYFLDGIHGLHWTWERATLLSGKGEGATEYAGCRFKLQVTIF